MREYQENVKILPFPSPAGQSGVVGGGNDDGLTHNNLS